MSDNIAYDILDWASFLARQFPNESIDFYILCAQHGVVFNQSPYGIASKKIERRQNVVHEKLIPMTYDGEPTCATNVKLIFRRKGLL